MAARPDAARALRHRPRRDAARLLLAASRRPPACRPADAADRPSARPTARRAEKPGPPPLSEEQALKGALDIRLAYIVTGDKEVDDLSQGRASRA